jgi:hypothetical protein
VCNPTGYSAPGFEKVKPDDGKSDAIVGRGGVRETFEVGRENDEVMPNIWLPEGILPGFEDKCLEFFWVRFCCFLSNLLRGKT